MLLQPARTARTAADVAIGVVCISAAGVEDLSAESAQQPDLRRVVGEFSCGVIQLHTRASVVQGLSQCNESNE
jgi:hypothetical protein